MRRAIWGTLAVIAMASIACASSRPDALPPNPNSSATTQPSEPTTMHGAYLGPVKVEGKLRLIDRLDDPFGYCIDVPGFGDHIRLGALLQAHTCKTEAGDQIFKLWAPNAEYGEQYPAPADLIVLLHHNLCITAESVSSGGVLTLAECSEAFSHQQRFEFTPDLNLRIDGPLSYCVGVSPGVGEPAGGANHLRRDLLLYDCDEAESRLITWELAEP